MKVKEAIQQLHGRIPTPTEADLHRLYKDESLTRMFLRSSDGKLTRSASTAVLDEMDAWIVKVCIGIGWSEEESKKAQAEFREVADMSVAQAIRRLSG